MGFWRSFTIFAFLAISSRYSAISLVGLDTMKLCYKLCLYVPYGNCAFTVFDF